MGTIENQKPSLWKNYRFPLLLLLGIAVGCVLGITMGESAQVFKPFGQIFINMMITVVVPMVMVTIASAVGNMLNMRRLGKIVGSMLGCFIVTAICASIIVYFVVVIFPPAEGVQIDMEAPEEAIEELSFATQAVKSLTVTDFPELISKANMLPLIVFSIIFGLSVSALGEKAQKIGRGLNLLSEVFSKFISIIMLYAPIGLGCYFAGLIGDYGPELLGAYGRVMLIYYPLAFAYFFIMNGVYCFFAGGMEGVKRFFGNIITPAITAFTTGSSMATIPVNLQAAHKMGLPKDIRDIVVPMGAAIQMDGSCISAIVKIAFLFGIYGHDFSGFNVFFTALAISVMSGVVMGAIPGGGFIGEMVIVSLYGFPPEAFALIATIGVLVDPPATMLNAGGDTMAAMVTTRLVEGKKWIKAKINMDEDATADVIDVDAVLEGRKEMPDDAKK